MNQVSSQPAGNLDAMLSDATGTLTSDDISSARSSLEEVSVMYGDRDMAVQQNMITHTSEEDMY